MLVGPAGTGKTFTLDAVRAVYEAAGYRVIGAAPLARAAHELEQGAHIPAFTLHRLMGSWGRGFDLPDQRTLLVVDEAAMAGTRDLDAVVHATAWRGSAGPACWRSPPTSRSHRRGRIRRARPRCRALTIAELTENRRQTHQWERDALERTPRRPRRQSSLRLPDQRTRRHSGRLHNNDHRSDRPVVRRERHGFDPVLLAGTNATMNALNTAARDHHRTRDDSATTQAPGTASRWPVGERIVLRTNDYQATAVDGTPTPLLNGAHRHSHRQPQQTECMARLDHTDIDVPIPGGYIAAGGVDYGYALTSHRAQGGTGTSPLPSAPMACIEKPGTSCSPVGVTRTGSWLTQAEVDTIDPDLARHDSALRLPSEQPDDLDAELNRDVSTNSRAKTLALTDDPHADLISRLAAATPPSNARRIRHQRTPTQSRRAMAIVGTSPPTAHEVDRTILTTIADDIAVGQTVKPADRNNLGIVTAIDETAGTANVAFVSVDGRHAERRFRWDEIAIIEPRRPAKRPLTGEASAAIRTIVGEHEQTIDRWNSILAEHNVAPDDAHIYTRAVDVHVDRAAARLAAEQPAWLTRTLGSRPTAPSAAQVWDDAVRDIATYRARHAVMSTDTPFGPAPSESTLTAEWMEASESLAAASMWLDDYTPARSVPMAKRNSTQLAERRGELDAYPCQCTA